MKNRKPDMSYTMEEAEKRYNSTAKYRCCMADLMMDIYDPLRYYKEACFCLLWAAEGHSRVGGGMFREGMDSLEAVEYLLSHPNYSFYIVNTNPDVNIKTISCTTQCKE
jgi:CheY-like chemotaxis protein